MIGLFRVFLAVMVASDHTQLWLPFAGDGSAPVLSFFVMSGFYIALILDTKYLKAPNLGGVLSFYTNRALRIYPTYWCILIMTAALMLIDGQTNILFWTQPMQSAWAALKGYSISGLAAVGLSNLFIFGSDHLIISSFAPDGRMFQGTAPGSVPAHSFMLFPPAWTLAVELTFYLIAPFAMLRKPLLTITICVTVPFAFKWLSPGPSDHLHLAYCFAGMATYYLYKLLPHSKAVRVAGFAMTGIAAGFAVLANYLPVDNGTKVLIFVAMTGLLTPFAFVASHKLKTDRWLGNACYGVYVAHFAVWKLIAIFAAGTAATLLYFPVLIAAGLLIAKFIEAPIDVIRDRIARRPTLRSGANNPLIRQA